MQPAPLQLDESRRLAVLRELELLDTEAEAAFDALVGAAARATDCPIALITLVDEHRLWFKAAHGVSEREVPRHLSFCDLAIRGEPLLEVPDAQADDRFAQSPLVRDKPHARFYAGLPLQVDGAMLGTLCVIDTRSRSLSADERESLHGLAVVAAELLGNRRQTKALQAEHRRLIDFGRASGDWMWETDASLRVTWISAAFETLTGLSPDTVIGRPMPDQPLLDAQGVAQPHLGTMGELLRRHRPFSRVVAERQTPRGPLFVSRSAVPVFDDNGHFTGYRGTARDISAQVQAIRRSREKDALLRKLSSQVPGIIFQFQLNSDGSFHYPYASGGLLDTFGIDSLPGASDLATSLPLNCLHPDDSAGFVDSLRQSAAHLTAWQREYRIVLGAGNIRWLETRAVPERLADDSILWHGFTADISERKETELALRRSEERWEMAADAAGIGIAEADLADGRLSLDRRACINHGLVHPLHDFTFDDWLRTLHPDDRRSTWDGLRQAMESGATLESRYRIQRPDGREATLEITARGRYDSHGALVGLVGTTRDVSAQLEVERLQRDKLAAERANRAKSEFLSRVSHELRTPLNGILGFAQLMSLDRVAALAPEQQRRLDNVVHAGCRLLDLINDVLDLTRIESEEFSLRLTSVDAWSTLSDCLALIQPLAQEAGVLLPNPGVHKPCWVHADPRALEQVFMNLLSNAIKYNHRGGLVEVELATTEGPAPGDRRVSIAIRDQGRGMTDEQQAGLFQPFNRLGAENSRTEGSGLGLVICQRLVGAMNGKLRVKSRPAEGSTFTVDLPGSTEQAALPLLPQSPAPTQPAALPTGPRRVLYIEDEPLNMVLMEEVFRSRPEWTLAMADDGGSGARIARESQPDLVLIDMNLPDMNGLTLIQMLRRDPRTRALRCIALSADAMTEQIDAALAAGFDDYWTKPIDVQRVVSDLARVLAQPAPPDTTAH